VAKIRFLIFSLFLFLLLFYYLLIVLSFTTPSSTTVICFSGNVPIDLDPIPYDPLNITADVTPFTDPRTPLFVLSGKLALASRFRDSFCSSFSQWKITQEQRALNPPNTCTIYIKMINNYQWLFSNRKTRFSTWFCLLFENRSVKRRSLRAVGFEISQKKSVSRFFLFLVFPSGKSPRNKVP
jgi:hypothetical protein